MPRISFWLEAQKIVSLRDLRAVEEKVLGGKRKK
jgi:hypothetical protein